MRTIGIVSLLLLAGCGDEEGLVVCVESASFPGSDQSESLVVDVALSRTDERFCEPERIVRAPDFCIGVAPGEEFAASVVVRAELYLEDDLAAGREAEYAFVDGEQRRYTLSLEAPCEADTGCADGETCADGVCSRYGPSLFGPEPTRVEAGRPCESSRP